jgi:hypothetical protein
MENRINNTQEIIKMLETIDPQYLMYAISQMNEVFVPQCYFTEHAQKYGFEDVNEMRILNEEYSMYTEIDNVVALYVEETNGGTHEGHGKYNHSMCK